MTRLTRLVHAPLAIPPIAAVIACCAALRAQVVVTPAHATLGPNNSATFTATVNGALSTDVSWSREPTIGAIISGVYTAPNDPGCEAEIVKVTASSLADPSKSGSAVVTLAPDPAHVSDCRQRFEASIYLGMATDTFAAGEVRRYLNPDDAGGLSERAAGGFDFGYRLGRWKTGKSRTQQLWVYGETVHGVRSADIDCGKMENKDFSTCKKDLALVDLTTRPVQDLLKIIRNAATLEAFAGLRYEFATLNPTGRHSVNLYVKAQGGFLKASGAPGDIVDSHHVGFGLVVTRDMFQGSYFEFGLGRTDLFASQNQIGARKWNRKKLDGFLSVEIAGPLRFFTQITVDCDFGAGADSVQHYIGLEFDLRKFKLLP